MMKTPCFQFSKSKIAENWQSMKKSLSSCSLYYALKANSADGVIDVLVNAGASFDVASINEFDMLISKNVNPKDIICSLPVKSNEMIRHLYRRGCRYFVFDCYEELVKLKEYAPESKKILRLDVDDLGGEYIPYGMSMKEYLLCKKKDQMFLNDISGVTFFMLDNTNWMRLEKALCIAENVICDINRDGLIVNIGGGYTLDNENNSSFYSSLNELIYKFEDKYKVEFYAEPGRAIVCSAGSIVTKIDLIRMRKGEIEVFIDAGQQTKITMTPSIIEILNRDCLEADCETKYHFYGPLSSHAEVFSYCTSRIFEDGDVLRLYPMGAYSNCFASHWHGLPIADILMID